jgi:hypothetical protein
MARHTVSHALLQGAEYEPASETLFIDLAQVLEGLKGRKGLDGDLSVAVWAFREFKKLFPERRIRLVTVKGAVT